MFHQSYTLFPDLVVRSFLSRHLLTIEGSGLFFDDVKQALQTRHV